MVTPGGCQRHWDGVYAGAAGELSWFQRTPAVSLHLIEALGVPHGTPVLDAGGGASGLARDLVAGGFADVSVLDVSAAALQTARDQLGPLAEAVQWIREDVLEWQPGRRYGLWHDRAVFHFFTDELGRARYREVLSRAVSPGGAVILAAFAPEGPRSCSGLPVARYGPHELAEAMGGGFDLVTSRREEHVTPAGALQAFTWAALRRHPD